MSNLYFKIHILIIFLFIFFIQINIYSIMIILFFNKKQIMKKHFFLLKAKYN